VGKVEAVLEMRPKLEDSTKILTVQPLRDFCEIPPRLFLGEELLYLEFKRLLSLYLLFLLQKSASDAGFLGEELLYLEF
jgi:hypothetical protein